MPKRIVGYERSYPIVIDDKDVKDFLSEDDLDISWLKIAILYVD